MYVIIKHKEKGGNYHTPKNAHETRGYKLEISKEDYIMEYDILAIVSEKKRKKTTSNSFWQLW